MKRKYSELETEMLIVNEFSLWSDKNMAYWGPLRISANSKIVQFLLKWFQIDGTKSAIIGISHYNIVVVVFPALPKYLIIFIYLSLVRLGLQCEETVESQFAIKEWEYYLGT